MPHWRQDHMPRQAHLSQACHCQTGYKMDRLTNIQAHLMGIQARLSDGDGPRGVPAHARNQDAGAKGEIPLPQRSVSVRCRAEVIIT